MVLCVEDLHWADRQSQEVIATLARGLAGLPVLLVGTRRPGLPTALGGQSAVDQLTINALPPDETAELAALAVGVAALPAELGAMVAAKAEGNPLFTEEAVRSLVEDGALELRDGQAILTGPVHALRIPDRVQDVILARIDRLAPQEREALQLAAVLGRQFSARVLAHTAGGNWPVVEALAKLRTVEIVVQTEQYPEVAYRFKHALTHEVAYSTLLLERRRVLHRLAGEAIEELHAKRLPEHLETLACHFSEGRDWEKAFRYSLAAARAAADSYANQAAVEFYDLAFAAGEALGDAAPDDLAVVPEERMFAALTAGDIYGALAGGADIAERAGTLGQGRARGRALATLAYVDTLVAKDFARAETRLHDALTGPGATFADVELMARLVRLELNQVTGRLAEADAERGRIDDLAGCVDDTLISMMWAGFGAWRHLWRGQFVDARSHLERWLVSPPRRYRAPVLWQKGLMLTGHGQYEEALEVFHDVLAIAVATGDVISRARVLNSLGWLYTEVLDHKSALVWNQDGVEAAVAVPAIDFELEGNARINLGDTLLALQRVDEAEQQLLEVERVARRPTSQQTHMLWRWSQHLFASLGELRLAQGDAGGALALADECLALAVSTDSRKNLVKGHRLRGRALRALGRSQEAMADLEQAVSIAQVVGNPLQLWCSLAAVGRSADALGVIEDMAAHLAPERAKVMLGASEVQMLRALATP
jgi:tetratricopeptide (TPR) repeat protein